MYTTGGKRRDPYMTYNFAVEIEGLIVGGFSEVSGLGSEIKLESYEEGGLNTYTHQFPTRISYPNLVLMRGITESDTLWKWYQQTSEGAITLRNGTITLFDSRGQSRMWWHFKQAFPVKWQGPQLKAQNSTEVAVQQIELAHQGVYQL